MAHVNNYENVDDFGNIDDGNGGEVMIAVITVHAHPTQSGNTRSVVFDLW